MIQAVATIIGVIVTVVVAVWQNRRQAKGIEDDAREDATLSSSERGLAPLARVPCRWNQ